MIEKEMAQPRKSGNPKDLSSDIFREVGSGPVKRVGEDYHVAANGGR